MRTDNISEVSFGYHHPLKTAYLKGLLPTVKYGIYGKKLSKKTVSLEHITPASQGGKTTYDNLFLADKFENSKRGVEPIENFVTKKNLLRYLCQFMGIKNKYIDGDKYISEILPRFKYLFSNREIELLG